MTAPNEAQREQWDGVGGRRWAADAERRDAVLAPVADELFAAADLQSGEAVLDLGCGCGFTSLTAADAVAPAEVVGVDISSPMLALAQERAGDRNVRFVHADAQVEDLSGIQVDVALSRFGTMFFDDPVAAFANVGTAVRPGGRLCIATWRPLAANDWLSVPCDALQNFGPLPPAVAGIGPGMFSQSNAGDVEEMLTDAGWGSVSISEIATEIRLGTDAQDAADYIAGTGVAIFVLDTLSPGEREEAMAAVATALAPYERSDGVVIGAGIHIVSARR